MKLRRIYRADRWPRCRPPRWRRRAGRSAERRRQADHPAEVSAKLDADYADMDADKDGKVTAAEIDARLVQERRGQDRTCSRRSATRRSPSSTPTATASISRAEFDEQASSCRPSRSPMPSRSSTGSTPTRTARSRRTSSAARRWPISTKMDANKDGTVSPAEVEGRDRPRRPPAKKPTFKNTPAISRARRRLGRAPKDELFPGEPRRSG